MIFEKFVFKLAWQRKISNTHKKLQQSLNHGIVLKKVRRIIEFDQITYLKPQTDMNTDLRKTAKNDFEKDLLG